MVPLVLTHSHVCEILYGPILVCLRPPPGHGQKCALLFWQLAVGQHQWYHFWVGSPPILVYCSGDWDVHWGYGILTHGQLSLKGPPPERNRKNTSGCRGKCERTPNKPYKNRQKRRDVYLRVPLSAWFKGESTCKCPLEGLFILEGGSGCPVGDFVQMEIGPAEPEHVSHPSMTYCGCTKSISQRFKTAANHCWLVFAGESSATRVSLMVQDFVHPQYPHILHPLNGRIQEASWAQQMAPVRILGLQGFQS